MVTTRSLHSHYTVTTWSLRGHYALFSSKARSVPRQPSRANKSFLQKNMAEARGNIIKQVCENPRTGFGNQAETLKQARLQDSTRLRGL